MADIHNQAPKAIQEVHATQEEIHELTNLSTNKLARDMFYEQDQIASYKTHLESELDEVLNSEFGLDVDAEEQAIEEMNTEFRKLSRGEGSQKQKVPESVINILKALGEDNKFEANARKLTVAALHAMYNNPEKSVARVELDYDASDARAWNETGKRMGMAIENFNFIEWLNFYNRVRAEAVGEKRNSNFATLIQKHQVIGQLNQLAQIPVKEKNEDEQSYKLKLAQKILAFRDKAVKSQNILMKFRNPMWTATQLNIGLAKILFGGFIYYPLKYLARTIARKSGLVTHTGNDFFKRVTNRITASQQAAGKVVAGKKGNGPAVVTEETPLLRGQERGEAKTDSPRSRSSSR